jgi:hypothetical protein
VAAPQQLNIADAIVARIGTMSIANGYNFDLATFSQSFIGFQDITAFPALFFGAYPSTYEVQTCSYDVTMGVKFWGWVSSSDRRKDTALLMQDIRRMISVDETWGGTAEYTHIVDEKTDPAVNFSETVGYVELNAEIAFWALRAEA